MANRVIKFRVWNSKEKQWVISKLNRCCHISYNTDNLGMSDKFILQQFTGFFDKNNKEIFEGDIVKVIFKKSGDFICKIIYEPFGYKFYSLPEEKYSFPMSINDIPLEIEVIGNIFDNHELLSK